MTDRDAIRVVVRREISSRVRERSFLIATAVTVLTVILAGVAPALLGGDGPEKLTVVATGGQPVAIAEAAAQNDEALDLDITVRRVDTAAEVRALVDDETADAGIADGRLVLRDEDPELTVLLQQSSAQVVRQAAVREAGVAGGARDAILAPPPLRVDRVGDAAGDEKVGIATIAVIILYGQLLMVGFSIATGIIEEKTSRIVEVLLAAIRPWVLLTGKLIGIGLLGVAQLLLVGVVGAGAVVATGSLDVPGGAWEAVLVVLAFFLLGYALYAAMFAVAGAIVPRQEDMGSTTTPLTVIILLSFFAALGAANDTDGPLAQVLTYVPFCAPMIMPVRLIAGDVSALETVASIAIMLASAAAFMAIAVRIYTNAILRTGGRVKLLEAWRTS